MRFIRFSYGRVVEMRIMRAGRTVLFPDKVVGAGDARCINLLKMDSLKKLRVYQYCLTAIWIISYIYFRNLSSYCFYITLNRSGSL